MSFCEETLYFDKGRTCQLFWNQANYQTRYPEESCMQHKRNGKKMQRGENEDLEETLFQWFVQKRANNLIITDDLLREKARDL